MKNLFLMLCMALPMLGSFASISRIATEASEDYELSDFEAPGDLRDIKIISPNILDEAYFDSCYNIKTIRYTYHHSNGIDYEEIVTEITEAPCQ